ncbi:MAG: hypothetical protein KME45_30790 [Stenomitos rutilans HA7619-LM2]|jgi:hypothetical protein|nr:hypothetical protein [Stenomitos rutilans HA7619-LM2]
MDALGNDDISATVNLTINKMQENSIPKYKNPIAETLLEEGYELERDFIVESTTGQIFIVSSSDRCEQISERIQQIFPGNTGFSPALIELHDGKWRCVASLSSFDPNPELADTELQQFLDNLLNHS